MDEFEFKEYDRPDGDDPVDDETSFSEPQDTAETLKLPTQTPTWAQGREMPAGLKEADLASPEATARLVNVWHRAVSVRGLQVDLEFRASKRGDLLVRWRSEWLRLTHKRAVLGVAPKFLSESTLQKYGVGVTRALGVSRDLPDPLTARFQNLADELAQAEAATDLPQAAAKVSQAVEKTLSDAEIEKALATMHDPPLNLRELRGLDKTLQTVRGELTNNLAKLTTLDRDIARQTQKVREARTLDSEVQKREEQMLRDLNIERTSRLEAVSANREALRSQINRIREMVTRILNEDTTLGARLKTLFREQGITIVSIITALSMTISTLVLAITGGGGPAATPPSPPPDKGGVKEWVKQRLQDLGRLLGKLAEKAAGALPGVIGSIVSWLLSTAQKAVGWLAQNLWALVVAIVGMAYLTAKDYIFLRLAPPKKD